MIKLEGTDFQIAVWKELLNIPSGSTKTYKEIAIAISRPKVLEQLLTPVHKIHMLQRFHVTELLDQMAL